MKEVVLQPAAHADLASIVSYLTLHSSSPSVSHKFFVAFEQTCLMLQRYPDLGQIEPALHPRDAGGFEVRRCAVRRFGKYLIFYLQTESAIQITRILHGARDPALRLESVTPLD